MADGKIRAQLQGRNLYEGRSRSVAFGTGPYAWCRSADARPDPRPIGCDERTFVAGNEGGRVKRNMLERSDH
jgi:hypothetical protein